MKPPKRLYWDRLSGAIFPNLKLIPPGYSERIIVYERRPKPTAKRERTKR